MGPLTDEEMQFLVLKPHMEQQALLTEAIERKKRASKVRVLAPELTRVLAAFRCLDIHKGSINNHCISTQFACACRSFLARGFQRYVAFSDQRPSLVLALSTDELSVGADTEAAQWASGRGGDPRPRSCSQARGSLRLRSPDRGTAVGPFLQPACVHVVLIRYCLRGRSRRLT